MMVIDDPNEAIRAGKKDNMHSLYFEHCGINMEFWYISRMFKWYIQYSASIVQNCSS